MAKHLPLSIKEYNGMLDNLHGGVIVVGELLVYDTVPNR
jgi:hypothetical protein